VKGHLFGADNDGAAQLRKQRQQDARRRNAAERAKRDDTGTADTGQDPRGTRR
jgi:hypothetical protein